jgi:hypothetical protein
MDHIVYLDAQAGDVLYFININAEGTVRAKAVVSAAFHSEKMTEEITDKEEWKAKSPP